jgi:CO/xanthine dehydrogenase Mo-binding subunit
MKSDAPIIHDDKNEFVHHHVRKGDVDKGFAQADFIIERKFKTQFIEHAYIEPEAILAEPSEQGGVKVTGCVQNLFSTRRSVAEMLNLDLARVQIIQSTLGAARNEDRQTSEDGEHTGRVDARKLQASSICALL